MVPLLLSAVLFFMVPAWALLEHNVTDERVVIISGRVTCVSCHNPYMNEKTRLIKSNEGICLCLTCHRR